MCKLAADLGLISLLVLVSTASGILETRFYILSSNTKSLIIRDMKSLNPSPHRDRSKYFVSTRRRS